MKAGNKNTGTSRSRSTNKVKLVLLVIIIGIGQSIGSAHGNAPAQPSQAAVPSVGARGQHEDERQQQQQQQRAEDEQAQHRNTLADELQQEEFIDSDAKQPHSRKKRLVWITDDGRLALPPGTSLTFTPTIALPLVRHPPEGFFSNLTISFPVTIDFDKLGLTDNQNPLGDLPPIFGRSFGHSAGKLLGNYVARYLSYQRKRRDLSERSSQHENFVLKQQTFSESQAPPPYPELPARFKHIFHGGERVLLYGVVEDFLSTFGMDGKACLLRTICEIHSRSLHHFGVFGEMTKLFLTVTKSPYADLIPEYVRAQAIGEGRQAPGECFPYYRACPKSIFKALQNNYGYSGSESQTEKGEYHEQEAVELLRSKLPEAREEDLDTNELPTQNKYAEKAIFM